MRRKIRPSLAISFSRYASRQPYIHDTQIDILIAIPRTHNICYGETAVVESGLYRAEAVFLSAGFSCENDRPNRAPGTHILKSNFSVFSSLNVDHISSSTVSAVYTRILLNIEK